MENPFSTVNIPSFPQQSAPGHVIAMQNKELEVPSFSMDQNKFLSELRDFMNDFAETDLNVDSIEEAAGLTPAQANFYIKLYNALIAEEEEMNKLCDEEIERNKKAINLFREKRQSEINKKKDYFSGILKDFAMKELEGKKTKTIKLPYGNLSFKKQQPKYIYEEEETLTKIVKELNPELVKTTVTEKIDKSALKKNGLIKDGTFYLGEHAIDLVKIQPQDDKFEIK